MWIIHIVRQANDYEIERVSACLFDCVVGRIDFDRINSVKLILVKSDSN